MEPSYGITVIAPFLVVIATTIVFVAFIFAIFRFLRWFWGRLPSQLLVIESGTLDKVLAVLLGLAFFPALVNLRMAGNSKRGTSDLRVSGNTREIFGSRNLHADWMDGW
jgi:hypothetical protein